MLAREMKDHVIVVGYSHLGTLIVSHFQAAKGRSCSSRRTPRWWTSWCARANP